MTLKTFYQILDRNSDKNLSKGEFLVKMKQLNILDDVETQALFKFLDRNRDGKIGYAEFLEAFSAMNTQTYINLLKSYIGAEEPRAFFER